MCVSVTFLSVWWMWMPCTLRGGYFGGVMWCVGVLSELYVWQTHSPRADFLELHFVGPLQYETCHLTPSRPCKPWLRHFCEVSLSRAYEGFCFCVSACMWWVIGWFQDYISFQHFQSFCPLTLSFLFSYLSPSHWSSPLVPPSSLSLPPVNTVIAWEALSVLQTSHH